MKAERARELEKIIKAAEPGDAEAQWNLGCMYEVGYSVPENKAEAEKWYSYAAEQGD